MARHAFACVAALALLSLLSVDAKKVMNVGMNHQYLPGEKHTTFNPVIRDMLEKAAAAGDGPNNNKMGGSVRYSTFAFAMLFFTSALTITTM
mgnify:CR=1 FL=1|tara:strand:- start:1964 stop:2239 length:276 start_codon:yes stop_codon:yes gene_type:complete